MRCKIQHALRSLYEKLQIFEQSKFIPTDTVIQPSKAEKSNQISSNNCSNSENPVHVIKLA